MKQTIHLIQLAWRMLRRDWRSGHMTVLLVALLVAVTTHTTIDFLVKRMHAGMEAQATAFNGGDLVIRSPRPIPADWFIQADRLSLRHASTLEFSSVVFAGDNMLLSALKAVSGGYPLLAPLKVSDAAFAADTSVSHGPAPGNAWVERRVLLELDIEVGGSLDIGDASFHVEKVLEFEPDRSTNFYSLVPRVMIHQDDVAATGVVEPGSRLDYYAQFAGSPDKIKQLQQFLASTLAPDQSFLNADSQQSPVNAALYRAESYLRLASLMTILLAAVAIAMGAHFFSQQHFDTSALLRCFGLSSRQILLLFFFQLIALALITGLVGTALGWGLHFIAIAMLADLLPDNLPLPSLKPLLTGCLLALILLPGFALPALTRLQHTPPLRVLRRDLSAQGLSRPVHYLFVSMLVMVLLYWYVRDVHLIIMLAAGVSAAALLALLLGTLLMWLLNFLGKRTPLPVQAGLRNLARRSAGTRIQLLGFGLTGMAMLMVLLVRTELVSTWQNQLPETTPNHFAMNILPDDVPRFAQFLQQHQIISAPLYPMVRGRITHINQIPVRDALAKNRPGEEIPGAINRELNLSFAQALPSDNRIVAGQWWGEETGQADTESGKERLISIEQKLAEQLGVTLGDTLAFFVGSSTFSARITSIRTLQWESFQPNFFIIFQPGDLDGLPATWLTSFYLSPQQKTLLKPLAQQFPSLSVLEVDAILARVKSILGQVTSAVEFILLFALAAGLTITLAALVTTMPERYREGALMRTLGATSRQLRLQQWSEFFAIGLLAGLIASAGAELARFVLYWKIFDLGYTPAPAIWIMAPLLMGLLIGIAGHWSSRKILAQSPLIVLRDS